MGDSHCVERSEQQDQGKTIRIKTTNIPSEKGRRSKGERERGKGEVGTIRSSMVGEVGILALAKNT